jgi:hypothetical protein
MGLFDKLKDLKNTATNVIDTGRNSLQDAARTTGRLASRASNINLSDVGHTALDVAGFIPVVGAAADLTNAGWYAAKGDWKNASLSAAAAVPGVGDAAAAVKIGVKATHAVAGAAAVSKVGKVAKAETRGLTSGSTPLRGPDGRFVRNPNSSLTQTSKHKSPEYRTAQDKLKMETINDHKAPSSIRGWLRQEQYHRGNNPRNWRNPKGYDTGHADPSDNTRLRWETANMNRSRGAKFGR